MKKPQFDRFLAGLADEQEQASCEALLESSETVIGLDPTMTNDSLYVALQKAGDSSDDQAEIDALAAQIEQLIPQNQVPTAAVLSFLDVPQEADELGRIGRYAILEFIARGGSGVVFRAIDTVVDRQVCIKLLSPAVADNHEAKARFERESRALSKMSSPRITTILDIGNQRGLPYFVMPMLEGRTLRGMLSAQGRLDPATAVQTARQIAEGLGYAHRQGLLHRDIKPENVWIGANGDVTLLDFGLATAHEDNSLITRQGTVLGTPSYMSPEQVTAKPLDARSDLFSLGVVLVEMLTGKSPFNKDSLVATLFSVAGDEIDWSRIDPDKRMSAYLIAIVKQLLAKDPDQRLDSAEQVVTALHQCQLEPNVSRLSFAGGAGQSRGVVRWLTASAAAVAVCLLGLLAWNQFDKGTLIVKCNDPRVEVRIHEETVNVIDPVSGKRYEIRIGATPLPSGVYQLEATSADGDLVFSAQTITIRRGERSIVTVELKPTTAIDSPTDGRTNAPAGDSDWADASYDPKGSATFATTLWKLAPRELPEFKQLTPAIRASFDADDELRESDSSSTAYVSPARPNPSGAPIWNCDGSRYAQIDVFERLVYILDDEHTVENVLPVEGIVAEVVFDDRCPELVAISSRIVTEATDDSNSDRQVTINLAIWRLSGESAELLHSIPCSGTRFVWDRGYRILISHNEQFAFFRLDTGETFPIEGTAHGRFVYEMGVSPDSRFIHWIDPAGSQRQACVWDLKEHKLAGAFLDAESLIWRSDSNAVAVIDRNRESMAFDIWNVHDPSSSQRIDLPPLTEQERTSNPGNRLWRLPLARFALEPNFHRVAWLEANGELVVRDLRTNRQSGLRTDIDVLEGRPFLEWNNDACLIVADNDGVQRWVANGSGVDGRLAAVDDATRNRIQSRLASGTTRPIPASRLQIANKDKVVLSWDGVRSSAVPNPPGRQERPKDDFVEIDLNSLAMSRWESDLSKFLADQAYRSPNGNFQIKTSPESLGRSTKRVPVAIHSLPQDQIVRDFPALATRNVNRGIQNIIIHWTMDSRYVAVIGSDFGASTSPRFEDRNNAQRFLVYDCIDDEVHDVFEWGFPRHPILAIHPWRGGFMVEKERADNQLETWWIDIEQQSAKPISLFTGFESVKLLRLEDDWVAFQGVPEGKTQDPQSTAQHDLWFVKAQIGNEGTGETIQRRFLEFENMFVSPSGRFVQHWAYQTDDVDVLAGPRGRSISVPNDARQVLSIYDLEQADSWVRLFQDTGRYLREFQGGDWHDSEDTCCWSDELNFHVFDAVQCRVTKQAIRRPEYQSTPFGWMVKNHNQIFALDAGGAKLGQLVLFDDLREPNARPPQWIQADGRVAKDAGAEDWLVTSFDKTKVVTQTLGEFESNPDRPRLPRFERVPFLASPDE